MTSSRRPQPPLARAGLDRAGAERATAGLIESARADAATRVLVIHGDRAPLAGGGAGLRWVSPQAVAEGGTWAFLGRESAADGRAAVLAAVFAGDAQTPLATSDGWGSLRAIGGALSAHDAGAFVEALSLGRWLLEAPHCPACGALTRVAAAGWSRSCPSCGREHFPRTDPAVIVAVTSAADPDRLLLGSNAMWGTDRFSCFAGFVEAGESIESTVVREVREEAGIEVADLRYRGSQAWPYPRSLMLGFLATAVDDSAARPDGEEIVEVRWFGRDEIGRGLAGEGDLKLPGPSSIAHSLISDWHAGRA
ncbi:NAD(+) diphosphatase [Microbacterium sp. BWT-B31]|uniref:NAD(+) diphosphatase n=1 Tax=Microbacterium sp. BWT-B31 TaxID=3232072 RepID=UPI003528AF03